VSYAPLSSAPLVTVMCYCYLWCPTLLVLITLICNCVLLLQNSYFFCLCLLLVLPVSIWFADAEMLCYYKIETTQNRFGWFMTLAVTVAALVTLLSENRTDGGHSKLWMWIIYKIWSKERVTYIQQAAEHARYRNQCWKIIHSATS